MTPAIKQLESLGIEFTVHAYEHDHRVKSYGLEAAEKLGVDRSKVFKTLVLEASNKQLAVAVLPVSKQLALKKAAAVLAVKRVEMARPQKVQRFTGYVLGGVSPVGQTTILPTMIDARCEALESVFVSAGKRGLQVELKPQDLLLACQASFADLCAA